MRRLVIALAICAAAAACSDSDPAAPDGPVIDGSYTLLSINGQTLPYPLIDVAGVYRLQQIGGTMTLNTNRTFIEQSMLRESIETTGGVVVSDTTVVLNGTWTAEDSVVVLTTQQDGSVLFGFVSRTGRLVLNFESSTDSIFTYSYSRQP